MRRNEMKRPKELSAINMLLILRTLGPRAFARLALSRLLYVNHFYIVGKSLSVLLPQQKASASARTLSPVSEHDMTSLIGTLGSLEPADRRELLARIIFYKRGFTNCYAFRKGDSIAYLQWLVSPEENDLIKENYSGTYYMLSANQVMVENAFTFPHHRGHGYFQEGTRQLLELARQKGYKSAIAYIRKDRINPLNEFTMLGFKIIKIVTEYRVLGSSWKSL